MSSRGVSFVDEFGSLKYVFLVCRFAGIAVVNEQVIFLNRLFYHGYLLLCEGIIPVVSLFLRPFIVFQRNHFTLTL